MSTNLKVNPIYKVNYLKNENDLQKIIVFYGRNAGLKELFKREP